MQTFPFHLIADCPRAYPSIYIIRHEFEISVNKLCQLLKHFTKSIPQIHDLMLLYHRSSELSTLFTKSAKHYVVRAQNFRKLAQYEGSGENRNSFGADIFAAGFIVEDHLRPALGEDLAKEKRFSQKGAVH